MNGTSCIGAPSSRRSCTPSQEPSQRKPPYHRSRHSIVAVPLTCLCLLRLFLDGADFGGLRQSLLLASEVPPSLRKLSSFLHLSSPSTGGFPLVWGLLRRHRDRLQTILHVGHSSFLDWSPRQATLSVG